MKYFSSKSDGIDVDNQSEYEDMVGKIFEKKPKKVMILVEMVDIKKSYQKVQVLYKTLLYMLFD
jgi:hypothetical protein